MSNKLHARDTRGIKPWFSQLPQLLLVTLTLLLGSGASANDDWAAAKQAMLAGENDLALLQLRAWEPRNAGIPAFDFLLGQAASNAGEIGIAIMALERVLLIDPAHQKARLLLAQTYERDQEPHRAIEQYRLIQGSGDNQQAKQAERALERLFSSKRKRHFQGNVLTAIGYDSNANSGSHLDEFLNEPLVENSQAEESSFLDTRLNGQAYQPLAWLDLFAAVQLNLRHHESNVDFANTEGGEVRIGALRQWRFGQSSAIVRLARNQLDDEFNNDAVEFALSHSYTQSSGARWNLLLSTTRLRFEEDREFEGGRFTLGGLSYDRDLIWPLALQTRLSLFWGRHKPEFPKTTSERTLLGAQLTFTYRPTRGGWARFELGFADNDFDNLFLNQTARRKDGRFDTRLEFGWPLWPQHFLVLEALHQRNDSELRPDRLQAGPAITGDDTEIFSYTRNTISVAWRYEWGSDATP